MEPYQDTELLDTLHQILAELKKSNQLLEGIKEQQVKPIDLSEWKITHDSRDK